MKDQKTSTKTKEKVSLASHTHSAKREGSGQVAL